MTEGVSQQSDSGETLSPSTIQLLIELLSSPDTSIEDIVQAIGLTIDQLADLLDNSSIIEDAIESSHRIAHHRARLIAARVLPRAIAFLASLIENESAPLEPRRKAAATIIRMCHASPKEKHARGATGSSSAHAFRAFPTSPKRERGSDSDSDRSVSPNHERTANAPPPLPIPGEGGGVMPTSVRMTEGVSAQSPLDSRATGGLSTSAPLTSQPSPGATDRRAAQIGAPPTSHSLPGATGRSSARAHHNSILDHDVSAPPPFHKGGGVMPTSVGMTEGVSHEPRSRFVDQSIIDRALAILNITEDEFDTAILREAG